MKKQGKDLKVGDTLEVWWSSYDGQKGNFDTITRLEECNSLPDVFRKGARIAIFRFNRIVGMTIDNSDYYTVVENPYK